MVVAPVSRSSAASDPFRTETILTPDRRLRVFVSSTLEELAEERQAVQRAVASLHLAPVMFEAGARPHTPRALYRAYLQQSDVFLAVYWQHYGWIDRELTISGLEDEFVLAEGKPRLVYVKTPAPDRDARLTALIEQLQAGGLASFRLFRTATELRRLVADDLAALLSERFGTSERRAAHDGAVIPMSLPYETATFVGRAREMEQLRTLLEDEHVRLVTLTGAGGIGKSRLALRAAHELSPLFPDGICWVPVASVSEPRLLPSAIAAALRLRPYGPEPLLGLLGEQFRGRNALLVLDGFEHIVAASASIVTLLEAASPLKILVTSREALRLRAEHEIRVPSLSAAVHHRDGAGEVPEAVQLFAERAAATGNEVDVTDPAVMWICRRLEGVPLAIELAATQMRMLDPQGLLHRLESGLHALGGGLRDLPERQQSLRATLDWSYALLDEPLTKAFTLLGVMAGGFTAQTAEAICPGDCGFDMLTALSALVDKSLLNVDAADGQVRFRMLSMVRDYALVRLAQRGELDTTLERHSAWFLERAVKIGEGVRGPRQAEWLAELGALGVSGDADDILAATERLLAAGRLDDVAAIAWAMWLPVWLSGGIEAGVHVIKRALKSEVEISPIARARLHASLGVFEFFQGKHAAAVRDFDAGVLAGREAGSPSAVGVSLMGQALEEATSGDAVAALHLCKEGLRELAGDDQRWERALLLCSRSWAASVVGVFDDEALFEDAVTAARELRDELLIGMTEGNMSVQRWATGRHDEAKALSVSALSRLTAVRALYSAAHGLDVTAWMLAEDGEETVAVTLLAAADALRARMRTPLWKPVVSRREALIAALRERLGVAEFSRAWSKGPALRFEEATRLAIAALSSPTGSEAPARAN